MRPRASGRFNRLNDRFFKFLFANPTYKFLLIELLNEILRNIPAGAERLPPIVDITYADREAVTYHQSDKLPRFDVIATVADGRVIHIEVQVARDGNLLPRVLHYGARDYFLCTREGGEYSSCQVVFIVLMDFVLFKGTRAYHTLHRLLNVEDRTWHMRGLEFHFIEIPKLRRRHSGPVTGLERMLYYLGSIGGEDEMQALAVEDARVAKMMELEGLFRSNPSLLRDYLTRERERLDYQASLRDSYARGEARGQTRGRREGTLRTLCGLVRKGLLSTRDAALSANMTDEEFMAQLQASQDG